ncbi:hypothetical protein BU17DRAFT_90259 [Hysterangium stoloniferum]|nr:hypothetical protein BU17DRAFT_90259 [Hysterangium stoloniferum]
MKNRKSELKVQIVANSPNSYPLEDIYSAYFSPSPRLPVASPSAATQRIPERSRPSNLPDLTITSPDSFPQKSPRGHRQRSDYSLYRDSPILNNVSRSLTSLDLPPSPRVYIWDPRSFRWRVLTPEDQMVFQPTEMLQDVGSRTRQIGHGRHASEPLAPLIRRKIKQSSLRRVGDKWKNRDDTHPTWEFALRYAEPSPLSSFETAVTTPTTATSFSDVERRLLVQRAFNLTYISANNHDRMPYACISIAGQQVRTPLAEKGSMNPVWNSEFIFESVKDGDPVVINVWNVEGLTEQPTLQGSFMCTVRRFLLMQSMNDGMYSFSDVAIHNLLFSCPVLTLTLDRWPDEAYVLESIQCGSIVLRIQDLASPPVPGFPIPFSQIENIPRMGAGRAKYDFQSSSHELGQDTFEKYISIPSDFAGHASIFRCR